MGSLLRLGHFGRLFPLPWAAPRLGWGWRVRFRGQVQILAAEGLRNADWLSSGSDPYCLVTVGCSVGLTVRCMVVVVWSGRQRRRGETVTISRLQAVLLPHSPCAGQEGSKLPDVHGCSSCAI